MNLKNLYDALVAAQAEARRVANEIDALFGDGRVDEALAKRAEWDAAKARLDEIKTMYEAIQAGLQTSVAAQFVPAGGAPSAEARRTMLRAEFDQLSAAEKAAFIRGGGRVTDQ